MSLSQNPPQTDAINPTGTGQTNSRLTNSIDRFRLAWDMAYDAMVLSDPHGIVLAANPAYLRLYGFPEEAVVGHSFAIIFPT